MGDYKNKQTIEKKDFFKKLEKVHQKRNMTTSTQILRICSKRLIPLNFTRSMTVMTTPMLFKNDPIRLSEISAKAPKAENWFQRKYNGILSKYHAYMDTMTEQELITCGTMLSTHCCQGVDSREFFEYFDLPDTFMSWFLVSELHIYMVCNRILVGQTAEGQRIKTAIVKSFWFDVLERVKLLADIPTKKRRAYVIDLNEEFTASLLFYDCAFLTNEDKDLASVLWRRFYLEEPELDGARLELLVKYVRKTMDMLDEMPTNSVIYGNIKWLTLDSVNAS